MKPWRITESVEYTLPPRPTRFLESASDSDRPAVLFTEIKAITANWVTRNKTYYPTESLVGVPNEGTGAISFIYPYPAPLISDHIAAPNEHMHSVLPYGRIYGANFVHDPKNNGGYVRTIAAVTDPFAIEMIVTGRFLTVSIGSDVRQVNCSICGQDLVAMGLCDHDKGDVYGGKECYWRMGPIRARELSFVSVPSDVNAGVVKASIDAGEAKVLLSNTGADYLLDMASGTRVSTEHYRESTLGISKKAYRQILESAEEFREFYKKSGINTVEDYSDIILGNKHRALIRQNVKGL